MAAGGADQKVTSALLALLLGTFLASLLLEAGVRLWDPPLRVQVFRASERLRIHETPQGLWWQDTLLDRRWSGCPERSARPRVLLSGSSIFFGSATAAEDSLGAVLHRALGGACVETLAEPGYTFAPQQARLAEALLDEEEEEGGDVDVLLWEIWQNSPLGIAHLGDRVYNFGLLGGAIPDPWGLGDLNLALLRWSRGYELAMTTAAPRRDAEMRPVWQAFAAEALPRMQALAASAGARLLLVSCPPLDRSFEEQRARLDPTYGPLVEAAARAGVPLLDLGRALGETPPEAIRADRCCHWSEAGTVQVASLIAVFVEEYGLGAPTDLEEAPMGEESGLR